MKSVYLAATSQDCAAYETALALITEYKKSYPSFTVFRPFVQESVQADAQFQELLKAAGREADLEQAWGTTVDALLADEEAAMTDVVNRFQRYAQDFTAVLVVGALEQDTFYPGFLARLGRNAAHLGATVLPVVSAKTCQTNTCAQNKTANFAQLAVAEFNNVHAKVSAVLLSGSDTGIQVTDSQGTTLPVITLPTLPEIQFSAADQDILATALADTSAVVTPLSFTASLMARAKADRKRIVLPEASDARILQATAELLAREVADIILLGDSQTVLNHAQSLGLDIHKAQIVNPQDPALLTKYAQEFARLRASKGVTYEQAYETVQDISYFGTMMVHMGDADGMVSGAINTTAHTIVPSFQIIKTKPGADLVSSCFLMLMADRVYVYGDCAVTTNPTPEQLASIAISSAQTASQFGITARVAMLSYSTGTSGKGVDVDAVVAATQLAKERAPELMLEGPIQYDAAVDMAVASTKLPNSEVAGRANVFIFPDLNSGNIGYKAVQRSAGAIAVGPILQGLNKPVNDLSRGALVEDIVNTVAITAIQAQG